jgi:sirohydrochlorin ferrochelatase
VWRLLYNQGMRADSIAPCGILLVGHGTRDAAGRNEFLETARLIAELRPECRVEPCFLELAEPTIAAGLARLAEAGVRQVIVTPLLLFAAGHAKADIPAAVRDAARGWPEMTLRETSALDCHPRMLELSALRAAEALAGRPPIPAADTTLVLVGRGSRDAEATAAMHRFAQLRLAMTPAASVRVGFLAMARPSLEECLAELAPSPARRIILQPHLLFRGELLDRFKATCEAFAVAHPAIDCVVCPHLGPHRLLAEAICSRDSDGQ